jgi:TRAP-type C4-dicarboxylate transport system permease small subunit
MNSLIKINKFLNKILTLIGGVFLLGMIILTCANIFIRKIIGPIPGSFELTAFASAIVAAFALGYTQFSKGHIAVSILVDRYPKALRRFTDIINYGVCCILFSIAGWYVVQKALILKNTGELSETLLIIYYPFVFAVAFGCFILVLALFTDFLKALLIGKEGGA